MDGELIRDEPLLEIANYSKVYAELSAFPSGIALIKPDMPVSVFSLHQAKVANGTISYISAQMTEGHIARARALNEIARGRGQSLAQLALAWTLRDPRVSSALIGASRPEQIIENVAALDHLTFTPEELAAIDRYAVEGGINLWEKPSTDWKE